MANQCKDCRFYTGRKCSEKNTTVFPTTYSCSSFSAYSTRNQSELKQCKDCRFYGGQKCSEKGTMVFPTSSKCGDGSICR